MGILKTVRSVWLRRLNPLCLLGLLLLPLAALPAPPDPAAAYTVRRWTLDDGLPDSQVCGVVPGRDGYLWLATVRIGIAPPPQGEDVVQVEYIGEGTPDTPGGGAKESAAPVQQKPSTQPSANPATSPASAAAQPPAAASESTQPPAQTPAEAMPLPDQPLVVTETPLPDPRFALPPTSPPQLRPTVAQPRIEVPVQSRALSGKDSLLSIVQMPRGVPVATFAIGEAGAANAALFAVAMLANTDADLARRLDEFRAQQTQSVLEMQLPTLD